MMLVMNALFWNIFLSTYDNKLGKWTVNYVFVSIEIRFLSADPIGELSAMDLDVGLNGNFYFKIASIKPCFCGAPPMGEKMADFNGSLCSWALEMVNKCDVNLVDKAHRLCSRASLKYAPSWTSKEYRR